EGVKKILEPVTKEVKILFFKDDSPRCQYCNVIEELLEDIHSVNENVVYEVLDANSEEAKKYGIEGGPVLIFADKPNIRYRGIPSGHEFPAFLEDIVSMERGEVEINENAAKKIAEIDKPIKMWIFVTPTCPYCPLAVRAAHHFAFINDKITAEMIEAIEWSDLADKFQVSAVPKNVILDENGNELVEWEGALPEEVFAEYTLKAFKGEVKGKINFM
ncbi:MAG: glutaredoxin, partial [Candidatus Diapherotrites archaeon]|nr:glutaredoxin [Candidatus Diapherotrites archaeon]